MGIDDHLKKYRPNVGVVLFNKRAEVLLCRRMGGFSDLGDGPDQWRWQMPQGGIDKGEAIDEAAFRELNEETGISSATLVLITTGWLAYDFPPGYKKKRWKGQRQKYAVMLFDGDNSEIDLEADDHQEFDDWQWANLEQLPELIVPFKRPVYEELVSTLTPLRDFLRSQR